MKEHFPLTPEGYEAAVRFLEEHGDIEFVKNHSSDPYALIPEANFVWFMTVNPDEDE